MAPEQVFSILLERFGDVVVEVNVADAHPRAVVQPQRWHELALFLRDDQRLGIPPSILISTTTNLHW